MKIYTRIWIVLCSLLATSAFALDTGKAAPEFKGQTSDGKTVKLSDYKGKIVVLEWFNHGCPFVKKHYGSKNMQTLQNDYVKKGVVWLSINSGAEGKEGYGDAKKTEAERKEHGSNATALIIDGKGEIGHLYGAQTTPHMFVIDAKGKLVYQGAIDDKPSADVDTVKGAKNYVREALDATLAGKSVAMAQTKSYGCSVKY